jgi:hypothetical protein
MNSGVLGFPAQRADLGPLMVRAAFKLNLAGDTVNAASGAGPSATFKFAASAVKFSYNIDRIVYNATGDVTVSFINPMPDAHFLVLATAQVVSAGSTQLVSIHESDTGVNTQKRLISRRASDSTAQNSPELHVIFLA